MVACYRHLASCVGGCTDSRSLRRELQQTRERAQTLTMSCRNHLTARLRDKTLPEEERKVTELQWVAFSSCLELFYADMCKVYHMGNCFSVANNSATVQTGMQGENTEKHRVNVTLSFNTFLKQNRIDCTFKLCTLCLHFYTLCTRYQRPVSAKLYYICEEVWETFSLFDIFYKAPCFFCMYLN